jgi:hypothetical protein
MVRAGGQEPRSKEIAKKKSKKNNPLFLNLKEAPPLAT